MPEFADGTFKVNGQTYTIRTRGGVTRLLRADGTTVPGSEVREPTTTVALVEKYTKLITEG
ncbi:hypothetical protein BIV57_17775 [Mangrovactinospora gilvigrisea]|uniref:Uncharacterized protein n=1 Tax=Mangrovactinospora gilvigrisea TaxID=1428644 RepID=A0A1J7C947_9ACTN|nr:hypothetical protein [Mangrovactinospora gilvigrisea]OIV36162.1 hypothetical protein BIV57_17775 [Mangrovactinospora gilvigrisea]